ncbi:MAG: histidine kinase dimerization/phospho-acceptor domain-containing protein [Bryobacteraceae bacterium]|nr:histidine kinase dimerization/phospho-acceptor domain-containing protein [Bryobacteraceae bacterium]
MADINSRTRITGVLALLLFLLSGTAASQTELSLAEASRRDGPNLAAAHQNETIRVRGVVVAAAVLLPDYLQLAIQDQSGAGLTIQGPPAMVGSMVAGQRVEVTGRLEERAGLPVIRPTEVRVTGVEEAPQPQSMSIASLNHVVNTGRLVTAEGLIRWVGQNAGGEILAVGEGDRNVMVFLPWAGRRRVTVFDGYREGDRVRVTGVSSQYCPIPPFDRSFQILIPTVSAVSLISRGWLVSPAMFSSAMAALAGVIFLWWWRERKLRMQRTVLREIMSLSEDLIAASSMSDIARRIEAMPAGTFGAPELEIYLHGEGSPTLDRVITERTRAPLSIPLDTPIGSLHALTAVCYRNRAMLAVADLKRSPLIQHDGTSLPQSAVIAPMLAQGELTGVLVLLYRRKADLNADFQVAVQHLANQVAASLRLQDQQLMKEQLLRSEKMAAAGQLISGVAADLRTPLANVERVSARLLEGASPIQKAGLHDIASEAQRGLDLVDHLLSFSNMEKREPKPLDVHGMLARMLEMRREDMERREIIVDSHIPVAPVEVWADQAQLEQALLTTLVHAEEAATASADRTVRVASRITGSKVQITFTSAVSMDEPGLSAPDLADYFGFPVAQAILQSHGGDLRTVQIDRTHSRLELELPVLAPSAAAGAPARRSDRPARVMTALVVEPDVLAQRKLVTMLSSRGHRAIPVSNAEEAAEVVQRIQFDLMFCSTRLPGLNWVELYQRVRRRIGVFALLTEGFDPEASQTFGTGEGHVLAKPVEDRELDHVLGVAEVRWAVARQ